MKAYVDKDTCIGCELCTKFVQMFLVWMMMENQWQKKMILHKIYKMMQ